MHAPISPYLSDPNVQLMLEIQAGNQDAYTTLMGRFEQQLKSFFFQNTGDWQAAEDLFQDSFLRVYRARESYQPTARFSTWLYRLARNLLINWRRNKNRKQEQILPVEEHETKWRACESPSDQYQKLEAAETGGIVRRAVDQLPNRQREALVMRSYQVMSYGEIGDRMGLSSMAIKSLLSRARTNLRSSLQSKV